MTASDRTAAQPGGLRTFVGDITEGFLEITHNSLALLGVILVLSVALLGMRADLREVGEAQLAQWLGARKVQLSGIVPEPGAIERATAADPRSLPFEQARVTQWIARKYRVAPEPIAALVAEAYAVGKTSRLDPNLILAIIAIESSFNPFAQSPVGAQGLMQVMTQTHADKYEHFGGSYAAFDPRSNLRVGVKVLQECIARAGSLLGGLKYYVGAANLESDGGYADKVMAEYGRMYQVAKGKPLPPPATSQPAQPELRAANKSVPTPTTITVAALDS